MRLSEAATEERPPVFGWVTSGRGCVGATGTICEVLELTENPNGTFDTTIRAKAAFTLLEVWTESMTGIPLSAPLGVGYVKQVEGTAQRGRPAGESSNSESEESSEDCEDEPAAVALARWHVLL